MITKMVYGNDCNLMLAVRGPGYHSNPYRHDAEQLNYLIDGEIWVFIGEVGFLTKKGGFCRIPRNALRWAWNRSDGDCSIIICHAPACDPLVRKNAVELHLDGEGSGPLDGGQYRKNRNRRPRHRSPRSGPGKLTGMTVKRFVSSAPGRERT